MTSAKERLNNLYTEYNNDSQFSHLREPDINFVPGTGILNPSVMLIGEAPGAMENARSIPFVGPAGQELSKILKRVNIDIGDVYFSNVIKYWTRLPSRKTRPPTDEEIDAAKDYLLREIEIVDPVFVGLCGRTPTKILLPNMSSLQDLNGRLFNKKYVVLYHPAHVLYRPDKYDEVISGYRMLANLIETVN